MGGGGEIPVEDDRMDGWLDHMPRIGKRRERGEMGGGEVSQYLDKEWDDECVCVGGD